MKLQQLRFLATVAQSELNITTAAAKLHTTQPAVSKQLRQLEDELGFRIFERHGRALLRRYQYDFISLFAPHLTRREVDAARAASSQAETDALFEGVALPER